MNCNFAGTTAVKTITTDKFKKDIDFSNMNLQ